MIKIDFISKKLSSYQDTLLSISGAVVFRQKFTYCFKTIIKNQYVKEQILKILFLIY